MDAPTAPAAYADRLARFDRLMREYLEHEAELRTCTRSTLVAVISDKLQISPDTGRKYLITCTARAPDDYTVWKRSHDTIITLKPRVSDAAALIIGMRNERKTPSEIEEKVRADGMSIGQYVSAVHEADQATALAREIRQASSNNQRRRHTARMWFG